MGKFPYPGHSFLLFIEEPGVGVGGRGLIRIYGYPNLKLSVLSEHLMLGERVLCEAGCVPCNSTASADDVTEPADDVTGPEDNVEGSAEDTTHSFCIGGCN